MVLGKKGWPAIKVIVFLLSLLPFLLLTNAAVNDRLGANPIEALHFGFGDWALRFLCITLALTPIKIITGQNMLLRFKRMMGLYAFFYASLHLLVFIVLDLSLSWEAFKDEVPKSPYILMGLLTYLLLIPLAVTSTKKMQKWLGRSWLKLHRLSLCGGDNGCGALFLAGKKGLYRAVDLRNGDRRSVRNTRCCLLQEKS